MIAINVAGNLFKKNSAKRKPQTPTKAGDCKRRFPNIHDSELNALDANTASTSRYVAQPKPGNSEAPAPGQIEGREYADGGRNGRSPRATISNDIL